MFCLRENWCFSGNGKTCHLEPGKTVLYTWDDPLKKREMVWTCGNEKEHKDKLVEVYSHTVDLAHCESGSLVFVYIVWFDFSRNESEMIQVKKINGGNIHICKCNIMTL